jgi:transposase
MIQSTPARTESTSWPGPFQHLVGFDWGKEKHVVHVLDPTGATRLELSFSHSTEGWRQFREGLQKLGPPETAAVAIETNCGLVVEQLLDLGVAVFPVAPVQTKGFRDRKGPSGAKDDRRDAYCLADALRTDGSAWRRLRPDEPLVQELKALCRDEITLIEKRVALYHELSAALAQTYPTVLEAFDVTLPPVLDFLVQFPTAAELTRKGKRAWQKFLHSHRMGEPKSVEHRIAIFAAAPNWKASAPAVKAKARLVAALVAQIRLLNTQLGEYRAQIEALFKSHGDSGIYDSLPGVGPKLGPRLLAFIGSDRSRFDSPQSLQCFAGTAPVTEASGQRRWVHFRRGCDKNLRATMHLWAEHTIRGKCAWASAYYQAKRATMSHTCAVRALAQRWLKIVWKLWQTGTTYDEAVHTRNQVAHGSWVLQPKPPTPRPA